MIPSTLSKATGMMAIRRAIPQRYIRLTARIVLVMALVSTVLLPASPVIGAAGVVRIMPLGDSITRGGGAGDTTPPELRVGYRQSLQAKLAADGFTVDFVGSEQSGPSVMDRDHEGHAGWTTSQILAGLPSWLDAAQPDVVLLLIGANDLAASQDPINQVIPATNRVAQILDIIESRGARTLVAPTTVLNVEGRPEYTQASLSYNDQIHALVAQRQNTGHPVSWVPMVWTFDLLAGSVHPSPAGYEVLATAWADALRTLLTPPLPCQPRPRVVVARVGTTVTISAASAFSAVSVTATTNASVSPVTITGQTATFTVQPISPGAWSVQFTVTDACGPWQTFVGAGS